VRGYVDSSRACSACGQFPTSQRVRQDQKRNADNAPPSVGSRSETLHRHHWGHVEALAQVEDNSCQYFYLMDGPLHRKENYVRTSGCFGKAEARNLYHVISNVKATANRRLARPSKPPPKFTLNLLSDTIRAGSSRNLLSRASPRA
jgi:hypothetical protein